MDQYIRDVLKIVVAQICQSIGWHGLQSSALEILIDVLHRYLSQITRISHNHAEHYGMTEPNLDHLGLAFHQMNISISELEEYISWVEPVPCILSVPQLPVARSTNLNFLKPGSREVVTRPVHIHEHLPPMHPELEQVEDEPPIPVIALDSTSSSGNGSCSSYKNINEPAIPSLSLDSTNSTNNICSLSNSFKPSNIMTLSPKIDPLFKRPGDFLEPPILKRKLMMGEEGRPTREISSVMMTSSGFLSPAREGKLPEARTPQTLSDSPAPAPQYPAVPPELRTEKKVRKVSDLKKKPYNVNKELFKSEKTAATNSNKLKKIIKKVLKHNNDSLPSEKHVEKQIPMQIETCLDNTRKIQNRSTSPVIKTTPKILKPAKLENVLQPPIMQNPIPMNTESSNVGKLSNEPDKMKLNIIKKISKVKEEKNETKPEKIDKIKTEPIDFRKLAATNRELHSPEITITPIKAENLKPEIVEKIKTPDIIIKEEPITSSIKSELTLIKSPRFEKNEMTIYDVDMLPAGTLSLPKTPEVVPIQLFPRKIEKEKKKREKKVKVKTKEHKEKSQKQQALQNSRSMQSASLSIEMARPKTPDGPMTIIKSEVPPVINPSIFSVLSNLPRGPSLIPPPINNNPLFSRLPFHPRAVGNRHGFGQPPLLPHGPHMLPVPVSSQVQVRNDSVEVIRLSHSEKVSNISGANVQTKVEITPVEISKNITEVVEKPEKKSKEHKKEKKDKVKLRKKKEKKDKIKNKDKSEKKKEKEEKKEKRATKREKKEKYKEKEKDLKETAAIKLTLKLGSQSSPPTEESSNSRKITIKPVTKKVVEEERSITDREPSPELARISALVTRPPKAPKAGIKQQNAAHDEKDTPSTSSGVSVTSSTSTPAPINQTRTHAGPGRPRGSTNAAKAAAASAAAAAAAMPSVLNKQRTQQQRPSSILDKDGNKVWICPACGGQDDGSPMIGCDDCDAWYHWVCVGIQVPPDDNEDWYCRVCIVKKQEILYTDKKKKRKKRDKRE